MKSARPIFFALLLACVAAAPTTRPTAQHDADPAAPPIEKPGWTLTFHDEFNGDHLDASKWNDHYYTGRTHANQEREYYSPHGYEVSGGMLRLIARRVPRDQRKATAGMPYTSGMIEGSGKFAQKYGWFEIRCRIPSGKGYWPAFWLLPVSKTWPPEIDILEILGHQPNKVYFTVHWRDQHHRHLSDGYFWKGEDLSKAFHTYAVDWEPDGVTWYLDGVKRAHTTKGVCHEPMYAVANLAVGGDWPGNPDAATKFPGQMDIDYVRVYQKASAR